MNYLFMIKNLNNLNYFCLLILSFNKINIKFKNENN